MKTNKQILVEAKEEIRAEMANEKKEEFKAILRQMMAVEETLKALKRQLESLSK